MIPLSVLDLAPIVEGSDARQSLQNSRALARRAEELGYTRYWLAEHHNMPGIASAATSVMIAYVGEGTTRIRLGAGGVMLPNHAPLQIAEQFGTLDAIFPGRIDLGLGRAPGTDQLTAHALRRTLVGGEDRFPRDVLELQAFLAPEQAGQRIRAVPGAGSSVPLWILGSSTFGAQLAAMLGLPFGFASHFAPDSLMQALAIYRERFQPSAQLDKPYAMCGYTVVAAATDEEAQFHYTSAQIGFANQRRGMPGKLPAPRAGFDAELRPEERAQMEQMRYFSAVGSPETVKRKLDEFVALTQADELIITSHMYDHAARLRSYEIVADAWGLKP